MRLNVFILFILILVAPKVDAIDNIVPNKSPRASKVSLFTILTHKYSY